MAQNKNKFIVLNDENKWRRVFDTLAEAKEFAWEDCEIFEVVNQISVRSKVEYKKVGIGNGLER